jgi:UDP-N-acetylglucosamine 2-epimerase (non-hydrolysing)
VVFPLHPRTASVIQRHGLRKALSKRVRVLDPLEFFASLSYQKHARLVMTDSGCVQEEAYILGTPCVTLRENTERHLTIVMGGNRLAGLEPQRIVATVRSALAQPATTWPDIYGKPGVGTRIVQRLRQVLEPDAADHPTRERSPYQPQSP